MGGYHQLNSCQNFNLLKQINKQTLTEQFGVLKRVDKAKYTPEKCREQQQPLFLAFVDLTKAFDLVSRSGLFKILQKIGCPPKLLAIRIPSFHQDIQSTVCFDGATFNAFPVSSRVKQGHCVLAPTLFGISFSMLLQYAFVDCTEGVYVRTRSDDKLFNIARLRAKTKAYVVLIRELLFADDAALTSHSEEGLHHLVDKLFQACKEFGLTISLRKTNILAQGAESPQSSPSTTRSWRLWTPSPTWAPPYQARLRSMLRSASGSPKQLLSWPNSTSECGAMTC